MAHQCKCCSHVSLNSDGPLCNSCSDLHARALERMEEGDGALELYVLVARIVFGKPKAVGRWDVKEKTMAKHCK